MQMPEKSAKQRELDEQKLTPEAREYRPVKPCGENARRGKHDYAEQWDRDHQSQRRLSAGQDVGRKHHEITRDVRRKRDHLVRES